MNKKKIILTISVLVVLGGSISGLWAYKIYSDKQNTKYINSKITSIKANINSNNLQVAQNDIDDLKSRVNESTDGRTLQKEVDDLTTELIQKENQNQVQKDLINLSALIKKGNLTEAKFEIQKIQAEDLNQSDKNTLNKLKNELDDAGISQEALAKEENAMDTLKDYMDNNQYENANNFIENLNTNNFSESNLAKISEYSKTIQEEENKFKISDYNLPTNEIVGFYKEAFPKSKEVATPVTPEPLYFINATPIYEVQLSGSQDNIVYLSPDGKNVAAIDFTTALNNKTLYQIENGKKQIATSIPSNAK